MDTTVNGDKLVHDSPGVNLMPPVVFWACLVCGGILEFLFPQEFPLVPAPVRLAGGLIIGAAGFAFMAAAHESFKRSGTSVPPNQPAGVFVDKGPYRFSRHPMYAGGSAFFLGIGLAAGSLWLLALYLPLALYLALYVIPREEAYMNRAFGSHYRQYRREVRRWL